MAHQDSRNKSHSFRGQPPSGLLRKSTQILDVGCGAGFLSNELARSDLQVTAIDISDESIKVATKHDFTGSVRYQVADAYHLPFADCSFDIVTAMDFLEHVERPGDVIREVSRVLRPGGLFIFHTFNRNIFSFLVIIKFVEWFVKNTAKDMHILRLFIKPKELALLCREVNLTVQVMVGLKPVFSTIAFSDLLVGFVPPGLKFELTKCLALSYMGLAAKDVSR
jgi:2-polyprenyl-6-hydroxyphenyl methylase / 3-demethylubiquinone-9 3-methyltransferase